MKEEVYYVTGWKKVGNINDGNYKKIERKRDKKIIEKTEEYDKEEEVDIQVDNDQISATEAAFIKGYDE